MDEPEPETPAPPSPEHETVVDEQTIRAKRMKWLRVGALAVLFVGSLTVARVTGLSDSMSVEYVRDLMQTTGAWGFFAFVGIFTVGELMHVPGLIFVGAASVAYGQALGVAASFAGALTSVVVSFLLIRAIGGQPLSDFERPFVRKVFARLEEQPIRTVAVLRVLFILSPALNYALAMSKVRFRDFVLGSALGLALPIPLAVIFFDYLATLFLE